MLLAGLEFAGNSKGYPAYTYATITPDMMSAVTGFAGGMG